MAEEFIPLNEITKLEITSVGGNLYLTGWNREDVRIKELSDQDLVEKKKKILKLTFSADAIIHLPHSLTTSVGTVGGDLSIHDIKGQLEINTVGGDLSLINIDTAKIKTVGGDSLAKRVQGDLLIDSTGGDGLIDTVNGQISLRKVGGDAQLEKIDGGIELNASGEVRLNFNPVPWQAYQVIAGGDISATIPENSSAELSLISGQENITVIIGDLDLKLKESQLQQQIGEGGPVIMLEAGGKVFLSGEDFTWISNLKLNAEDLEEMAVAFSAQTADQIKGHLSHLEDDLKTSLEGLSESLESVGISEENLNKITSQIEESSRQAAQKAEIAAIKAQAKIEKKIAIARKKALKAKAKTKEFDLEDFLSSKQEKKSITGEERLLILNMLQEKKISPEEADDLLKALEGKKRS
jgi:hypothetical protein